MIKIFCSIFFLFNIAEGCYNNSLQQSIENICMPQAIIKLYYLTLLNIQKGVTFFFLIFSFADEASKYAIIFIQFNYSKCQIISYNNHKYTIPKKYILKCMSYTIFKGMC